MPQKRRHVRPSIRLDPPGTPTPGPEPWSAVTVRLSATSTVSTHTTDPELKAVSSMMYWNDLQPDASTYDFAAWDTSIADAHTDGYKLILRVMMGCDAPIGRPGLTTTEHPAWMRTGGDHPVECIRGLANEISRRGEEVWTPVPWDPNQEYWHHLYAVRLGEWLEAPCPSGGAPAGHSRSAHVWWVTASMPTELGSEGSLHYSLPSIFPAYASGTTVKLASSITAGQTSFTLTGTVSGWPSGDILLRIKRNGFAWQITGSQIEDELIWATRSGSTITVQTGGRGFCRTDAKSHPANTVVTYALDNGDLTGSYGSPIMFNGVSGVYDQYALGRNSWDKDTTPKVAGQVVNEANRRSWTKTAWLFCIQDLLDTLPSDVAVCFAGGNLFQDAFDQADQIVEQIGPLYATAQPGRLFAMVTDLKVNSSGAKPWHYPNASAKDLLNRAAAAGWLIGLQTASSGNVGGADNGDEVIQACEDALDLWPTQLRFIEIQNGRMGAGPFTTAARGAWGGGTISAMRQYFTGDAGPVRADNLQDRIPSS